MKAQTALAIAAGTATVIGTITLLQAGRECRSLRRENQRLRKENERRKLGRDRLVRWLRLGLDAIAVVLRAFSS